jgi:hypothetical protein
MLGPRYHFSGPAGQKRRVVPESENRSENVVLYKLLSSN